MLRLLPLRRLALQSFRPAYKPSLPLSCRLRTFSSFHAVRQQESEGSFTRTNPHNYPPRSTLYISNLPFTATAADLEKALEEFPGIVRVNMSRSPDGRSRGFCHVDFDSIENATAVLNAHSESAFVFGDREITVGYGRPAATPPVRGDGGPLKPSETLYVGNLAYEATDKDLSEVFSPFGQVSEVRIGRDRFGGSRGFAHVQFSQVAEAERAMTFHTDEEPLNVNGRPVRLDFATVEQNQPGTRLYFRGFQGNREALRTKLDHHGKYVNHIYFLNDIETGEQTGSGFINFETVENATDAMKELSGQELTEGSKFHLEYARDSMGTGRRPSGRGRGRERERDRMSAKY